MRIGEYRSPAISVVAGQYTQEDLCDVSAAH